VRAGKCCYKKSREKREKLVEKDFCPEKHPVFC
jgi:hypothetical protein